LGKEKGWENLIETVCDVYIKLTNVPKKCCTRPTESKIEVEKM